MLANLLIVISFRRKDAGSGLEACRGAPPSALWDEKPGAFSRTHRRCCWSCESAQRNQTDEKMRSFRSSCAMSHWCPRKHGAAAPAAAVGVPVFAEAAILWIKDSTLRSPHARWPAVRSHVGRHFHRLPSHSTQFGMKTNRKGGLWA